MKKLITASMLAMACGACSTPNSSGPALTAQECEAFIRKSWEVNEIPPDTMLADEVMKKAFSDTVQSCSVRHEVSRKDYDCVMHAGNLAAFQSCHAALHVR